MEERQIRTTVVKYGGIAAGVLLALLAIFVAAKTYYLIANRGGADQPTTVSFTGKGEAVGKPDVAIFTAGVIERAKTVAAAQSKATDTINKIVAYLKTAGVEDRDVQTSSYNIYPTYEYESVACSMNYCPPGRQVLTGYEVSQMLTIKVRSTDKAGEILAGVGSRGANNVSGLTLTIDKAEDLEREARQKAIADAKEKAEALAKDLNVRLVKIVGFSESGNYPYPVYRDTMAYGKGGAESAPSIPTGENTIVSNVTIVYEIR